MYTKKHEILKTYNLSIWYDCTETPFQVPFLHKKSLTTYKVIREFYCGTSSPEASGEPGHMDLF